MRCSCGTARCYSGCRPAVSGHYGPRKSETVPYFTAGGECGGQVGSCCVLDGDHNYWYVGAWLLVLQHSLIPAGKRSAVTWTGQCVIHDSAQVTAAASNRAALEAVCTWVVMGISSVCVYNSFSPQLPSVKARNKSALQT